MHGLRLGSLVLLLALVACGAPQPLPDAGAQGPIVLRQWGPDGGPPLILRARSLHQVSGRPGRPLAILDLGVVRLRVPFADGVAEVECSSARYGNAQGREAVLPGPEAPPHEQVGVAATIRGLPAIGQASRAWLEEGHAGAVLEDVELVHFGAVVKAASARLVGDRSIEMAGGGRTERAPAAVRSALAALPEPFVIPP